MFNTWRFDGFKAWGRVIPAVAAVNLSRGRPERGRTVIISKDCATLAPRSTLLVTMHSLRKRPRCHNYNLRSAQEHSF